MPLSTDKLPNRALGGDELGLIIQEEVRRMIARDYRFMKTVAYRRAAFSIVLTVDLAYPHPRGEMRSRAQEHAGEVVQGEAPLTPEPETCQCGHVAAKHAQGHGGENICTECECADFKQTAEALEHEVSATEVSVKLDNPNLDRIHHGLPIKVQRALPPEPPKMPDVVVPGETPAPQEAFGKSFETQEFKYDPQGMPPVEAPVVTDVSEREAQRMGVSRSKGMGYVPKTGRERKAEVPE